MIHELNLCSGIRKCKAVSFKFAARTCRIYIAFHGTFLHYMSNARIIAIPSRQEILASCARSFLFTHDGQIITVGQIVIELGD